MDQDKDRQIVYLLPLQAKKAWLGEVYQICVAGFSSRGAKGVDFVRSCQKISLCPTDPMPASSKMDPSLAKAKPISDGGSISVIMYLRRGNTSAMKTAAEDRCENT